MGHKQGPYPMQGSPARPDLDGGDGFRDPVILGATAKATAIADGASATLTHTPQEPAVLSHLCIDSNAAVALVAGNGVNTGVYIGSLKVRNRECNAGVYSPAAVFARDSAISPYFGHRVIASDSITVVVYNESGAGIEVGSTFTTL